MGGVHFFAGVVGALMTGIYADPEIGNETGMLFGNSEQLGWQIVGCSLLPLIAG